MVHRAGFRSGDSTSLHILQEPTRAFPGVEAVRPAVRTDRATVGGRGAGAGQTSVGAWQLRGGQRSQGEPDSAGAVSGSSTGASHREPVSEGSGSAKPGGGTGARARSGIN